MAILDRLNEALGLVTQTQLDQRITETSVRAYEAGYEKGFYDGNDDPPSGALNSYGYRRATQHGLRDFSKLNHDEIIEIVWTLYQSNPIAKRYLQLKRDYILGRGVTVRSDNKTLQETAAAFIVRNNFQAKIRKWVLQLWLWGEQCYPVAVRKADGAVIMGYIDPAQIETVVAHPNNTMEAYAVCLKADQGQAKRVLRIIRPDFGYSDDKGVYKPRHEGKYVTASQATLEPWESELLKEAGLSKYSGSCFYFTVNNVSNQTRGFSDLLQVADWLDSHDETLFALADREQFAGYFSWDVKLTNADASHVKTRRKEIQGKPPKRGSVNVHNDAEEWQFNYPDLKTTASIASAEAIETHALGGLGLPRHFYAHGDGTNRATAMAQADPTYKTMQADQDVVAEMITTIFTFVHHQAEIGGLQLGKADIDVMLPEMATKDISSVATSLTQVVNSLNVAVSDLKVITLEVAAQAVAKVLAELDIEYDVAKELKAAQTAAKEEPQQAQGERRPVSQEEMQTSEKANEWLNARLSEVNGR